MRIICLTPSPLAFLCHWVNEESLLWWIKHMNTGLHRLDWSRWKRISFFFLLFFSVKKQNKNNWERLLYHLIHMSKKPNNTPKNTTSLCGTHRNMSVHKCTNCTLCGQGHTHTPMLGPKSYSRALSARMDKLNSLPLSLCHPFLPSIFPLTEKPGLINLMWEKFKKST